MKTLLHCLRCIRDAILIRYHVNRASTALHRRLFHEEQARGWKAVDEHHKAKLRKYGVIG